MIYNGTNEKMSKRRLNYCCCLHQTLQAQTAWIALSLPLFKSELPTGTFAWNADCLEGSPNNFMERGEGSLSRTCASPMLRWDIPTSSSTLTGSFGMTGIGLWIWWWHVSPPLTSSKGWTQVDGHMGKGTGKYAGKHPWGAIGVNLFDPIIGSLVCCTFSWEVVSIGSNSDLRERFNEGCDFSLQGCEFSGGGSSTCSSGTEGWSEDWHMIEKTVS